MSPRPGARVVSFDARGFTLLASKDDSVQVSWSNVTEVFGFKRDRLTVDEICLGFRYGAEDSITSVGEEDVGFEEFRGEVARRFKVDAAWLGKIVKPAFAENRTTLWQRA